MNNKPIIFLDFDGVVHPVPDTPLPSRWSEIESEIGRRYFHIPSVGLLNCLCARLDAEIVLISSWRHLEIQLNRFSSLFKHRLVDQTPDCPDVPLHVRRETEIFTYLDQFESDPAFVVIDDQSTHYDQLAPHLVCPNSRTGLNQSDVVDAYRLMNDPRRDANYYWQIDVHRLNQER